MNLDSIWPGYSFHFARFASNRTGRNFLMISMLGNLAPSTRTHAKLGQFDDAWRCISEAMTAAETTKEKWYEAEIHRSAGTSPRSFSSAAGAFH
jgi:hypothetical protein